MKTRGEIDEVVQRLLKGGLALDYVVVDLLLDIRELLLTQTK